MPAVAILLDKINKPNNGLSTVSVNFSRALEQSTIPDGLGFFYFVHGKQPIEHIDSHKIKRLKFYNKVIPAAGQQFDILHKLHQSPSFKITGARRTILTIHDLNFLFTKTGSKIMKYLKRVQDNVDQADALVFISEFTKATSYKHLRIPQNKLSRVIYNGVSLPDAVSEQPDYILSGEPYLFSIGQFLPKKNFHTLLPFISLFPEKMKLVLAGENNTAYGSYIRNIISEYKLESQVVLTGPVSEAEKKYLYENCKGFLFPSLAEGFGLPVIEAMRAGVPVFCSDQTSLKEIADKHACFWTSFEPENMKEVFDNGMAHFSEFKKKEAYDYSLSFTWAKNAAEYIDLYSEVLTM